MRFHHILAHVAALAPVVGACGRVPRRTLHSLRRPAAVKQGQSLTELALLLPILLLSLLGAGNLGFALQQQTALTQAAQQAAQYLLQNPAPITCGLTTNNYQTCTENQVASYLNAHGYSCSSKDGGAYITSCYVTVTFSTSVVGSQYDLLGTINVTDQFPLAVPMPSKLNGWLNGSPCAVGGGRCFPLNAQVVTILPTDAPTNVTVASSGSGFLVSWAAPSVTTLPGVSAAFTSSLSYRVYSWTSPTLLPNSFSYTDPCTQLCRNSGGHTYYSYTVTAVQTNGMESSPQSNALQAST